jgi:hypothetical protein
MFPHLNVFTLGYTIMQNHKIFFLTDCLLHNTDTSLIVLLVVFILALMIYMIIFEGNCV